MSSERKTALVVGVCFILTFVGSIPALAFYAPVLGHPEYVLGADQDWSISLGALLEIVTIVGNVGSAVAMYPLMRRTHPGFAMGWVAERIVESTLIAIGIVSLLAVALLRRQFAGATDTADAAMAVETARSLIAVHDVTFLLGPAFGAPIGNGLLLGWMMFSSRRMPRVLTSIGLLGGTMGLVTAVAVLFGLWPQMSLTGLLFTLPEIVWEASVGLVLTFRGFSVPRIAPRAEPATVSSAVVAGGA
jgi:hypothetical protein